jgi:hypothetical protein
MKTISEAINESSRHNRIVKVESVDEHELREAIEEVVHWDHYDISQENDGTLDVYSLTGAAAWRLTATLTKATA